MTEMILTRTVAGTLAPTNDDDLERIRKIKAGTMVRCKLSILRNGPFHRKFFALLTVGYNYWSERIPATTFNGYEIEPDFEFFREQVTIKANHFRQVFALDGRSFEIKAKSISFASMEQEPFERLYSRVIDVLLKDVLADLRLTREQIDEAVNALLGFDG